MATKCTSKTTRDAENVARRLGITVAVPSRTACSNENITISKVDEEVKGSTFQSDGQNTNMLFKALLFTFTLKYNLPEHASLWHNTPSYLLNTCKQAK